MTDGDSDDGGEGDPVDAADDDAGVPDSDPRHLDPAGDMADLVESGEFDIALAEDQDAEELREFVRKAEAGEFDLRADPGLEATVRIARAILEQSDDRDAVDDEDTDN